MEIFLAFLIKISIIFIGSGLATLFACYIAQEASTIPKLLLDPNNVEITKLTRLLKISTRTGLYEILLPSKNTLKIFSSHKGMKII